MWWIFITMICFHSGETKLEDKTFIPFVTGVIELPEAHYHNKCIEDLGCFDNGPPFHDYYYRPGYYTPDDCLRTQYLLFTHANPNAYQLSLTEESIAASPINPNFPTKILIHGYSIDLKKKDTRFLMKDEFLLSDSFNVIIIDWTEHNKEPYPQAVANGRVVGARIAKLLTLCVKVKGVNLQMVHIIGHSLGAHIAGWAGERLDKVGRISGLDPAGPYFQKAPNIVRLDTSDANFVDVIHTNGGTNFIDGLGLMETIGHMDFFPNGGKHQPGCILNSEMGETLIQSFEDFLCNSCDHNRANELFIESINGYECLAVQCEDYIEFKHGDCADDKSIISVMGFRTKKLEGLQGWPRFFLQTSENSPYCKINQINDTLLHNAYNRYNMI